MVNMVLAELTISPSLPEDVCEGREVQLVHIGHTSHLAVGGCWRSFPTARADSGLKAVTVHNAEWLAQFVSEFFDEFCWNSTGRSSFMCFFLFSLYLYEYSVSRNKGEVMEVYGINFSSKAPRRSRYLLNLWVCTYLNIFSLIIFFSLLSVLIVCVIVLYVHNGLA